MGPLFVYSLPLAGPGLLAACLAGAETVTPPPGGPGGPGGAAIEPLAGASLPATAWRVISLGGLDSPDPAPTLVFSTDGHLTGQSGCNRYSATYTADGRDIRFAPVIATRMACAEPGVMAQEQALLRALEAARTIRIEADVLELRDADRALQVIARADAQRR